MSERITVIVRPTLRKTVVQPFLGVPGAVGPQGERGPKGDQGSPGSDASVTAANIGAALGYTPASGSALSAESAARSAADSALGTEIASEATARQQADTTLQAAIEAEAAARQQGDADLQAAIDGKAAASHAHPISNVTGLQAALDGKQPSGDYADASHVHEVNQVNGLQAALDSKQPSGDYATLDGGGKIPAAQLPSYVDDVLEFANLAAFPAAGETGKIYVDLSTNKTFRWSGSAYVEISASPGSTDAVPEGSVNLYHTTARAAAAAPVQSVAGRAGDVALSKSDVGLSQVDNTSDAAKPVSTAQQAALDGKAALVHAHAIADVTGLQTSLDGKAATSHTHTKSQIADFAHTHPISEVTNLQTALDGKAATSHTHAIADVTGLQTSLDGKASAATVSAHIANTSNPHSTTAAQVGAEPTQTAATQAEAESGTSTSTRSFTPQRIAQAITALAVNFLRGAANIWSANQTFNGTSNTAPNQTAASGSSLMTRNLLLAESAQNLWLPLSWNTPTGSGGTSSASGLGVKLSLVNGDANGAYRMATVFTNPLVRYGAGTTVRFASPWSFMFDAYYNGQWFSELRLLFGVSSTATELTAAGVGFVWTAPTSAKLQIHNGTALSETAVTISRYDWQEQSSRFLFTFDGTTFRVHQQTRTDFSSWSRWSLVGSLAGSSLPTWTSGSSINLLNIATSSGTGGSGFFLNSMHFAAATVTP